MCRQIRLLSFFVLILSAMSAAGQSICFFYFTLNEGKIASYCLALDKFIVEAYFKPYRGPCKRLFLYISRGGDYAKKYNS
jgi:hypothetical protein